MNTKDILLESASGFMMPFEASEEEEVQAERMPSTRTISSPSMASLR